MVFSEQWFKQNQWWLLPYVSHDRDNLFIGTNKPLVEIAPDHVSWLEEPGLVTTEFHVHHVYGRRLYQRLSPLWNLMHHIDMSTWARRAGFNMGFDTLTVYPDAHPETDTVDGWVGKLTDKSTWSALHDATIGTVADTTATVGQFCYTQATNRTNQWIQNHRSFYLFKTSTLTAAATISAATLSLYKNSAADQLSGLVGHVAASSPASDTNLVTDDYDQLGSTSFGSVAYANFGTGYNDISLNASGITNIAKTGISKFGGRTGWDLDNSPPTWVSAAYSYLYAYFADDTTANNGKDPKLVVTYSAAATFVPQCIFL